MPFVPVANTAEVKLFYRYEGQQLMNTLYFKKSSAWDTATLQALADSAWDHWATSVVIDLNNKLTFVEAQAVDLTTATSGQASHIESLTGSNTSGIALPGNCAFCIKFTTANRGRSFRGRIYLPGLVQAGTDNPGTLPSAYADALLEDVSGVLAAIAIDTGTEHVVVSRFSGIDSNGKPIPRTTGIATPVTAVSYTDLNTDSQRKRLPGRGV